LEYNSLKVSIILGIGWRGKGVLAAWQAPYFKTSQLLFAGLIRLISLYGFTGPKTSSRSATAIKLSSRLY
jgi:hypothetical protein